MRHVSLISAALVAGAAALAVQACGSNDETGSGSSGGQSSSGSPDQNGAACKVASECYPDLDGGMVKGTVLCLTDVRGGYCTHECTSDADCCAVPGECKSNLKEVCAPFEATGKMMCFLSCEPGDIGNAASDQAYCEDNASYDFLCRSTGGGANNRKVCVPGDCGVGARCAGDADCAAGLACVTDFSGGYCSKACSANADCPANSLCGHTSGSTNYCLETCAADADCSFCRSATLGETCSANATFADGTTTGSVCAP